MNSIRQKWMQIKTYQRIQKLWNEYKNVPDKNDVKEIRQRLLLFLDSFQTAYQEWGLQNTAGASLDKLYGDCTEVLLSILQTIDKETSPAQKQSKDNLEMLAALINKALNVAELILKDEKYRRLVAGTPQLINSILTMLEKLNTTETKKLALRVISTMADSTAMKLEIGRHEGFKKILRLLLEGDAELTQEIVSTFKHLADVNNKGDGHPTRTPSQASTFLGGMMGDAFANLWTDVGTLVNDMSSFFNVGPEGGLQVRLNEDGDITGAVSAFVPSKAEIDEAIKDFQQKLAAPPPGEGDPKNEDVESSQDTKISSSSSPSSSPPSAAAAITEEQSTGESTESSEMLKNFMRIQGALSSLVTVLGADALTYGGKLDIVETLSRLLMQSEENQKEFRRMDGYSILQQVFDKIVWEPADESAIFVQDCFNLFFTIALDGNKNMRAGNMDVLKLIAYLAISSAHVEVRKQALLCIQDMLSVHPLNVVYLQEAGGLNLMLSRLSSLVLTPPEQANSPEEMRYFALLVDLLNYAAVILSNHNFDILKGYSGILVQFEWSAKVLKEQKEMITYLLHAVSKLLMDYRRRSMSVGGEYLPLFLQMLRRSAQAVAADLATRPQASRTSSDQLSETRSPNIKVPGSAKFTVGSNSDDGESSGSRENDLEFADEKSLAASSRTSINGNAKGFRDVSVLLLQIIDLLIECDNATLVSFDHLGGFGTLLLCVSVASAQTTTKTPMAEMALWLLQDFVSARPENLNYFKWPVELLKSMRSHYIPLSPVVFEETPIKKSVSREMVTKEDKPVATISRSSSNSVSLREKEGKDKESPISSDKKSIDREKLTESINDDTTTKIAQQHLQSPLPKWLQLKICCLFCDLMHHSQYGNAFRNLMRTTGGLEALLDIVHHADDVSVADAALEALRDAICGLEANKLHLVSAVGYDHLLRCLVQSVCTKNRSHHLFMLEVSLVGNVTLAISPVDVKRKDRFAIAPVLLPYVQELLSPKLLFDEPLQLSKSRQTTLAPYVQPNSVLDPKTSQRVPSASGNHVRSHSRQASQSSRPSVRSHSRQNSGSSLSGWGIPPSLNITTAINVVGNASAQQSSSSSIPVVATTDGYESEGASSTSSYRQPKLKPTDAMSLASSVELMSLDGVSSFLLASSTKDNINHNNSHLLRLVGLVFRDPSAAMIVLKLHTMLPADAPDREEFMKFLLLLLSANPRNKRLLYKNDGLVASLLLMAFKEIFENNMAAKTMTQSLHPASPSESASLFGMTLAAVENDAVAQLKLSSQSQFYLDMQVALTAYDLSEHDTRLLLDFANDAVAVLTTAAATPSSNVFGVKFESKSAGPANEAALRHKSVQIMARVALRADPRTYIYLDGVNSSLSKSFNYFPASKTGFTFSCWFKVTAFLDDETGVLCLMDSNGRLALELTCRLIGTAKHCFSVRIQTFPAPPEDFVFDAVGLEAGTGTWHCLVFSQRKHTVTLYLDGALVQTTSSFNYEKPGIAHRSFKALIGRRCIPPQPKNAPKPEPKNEEESKLPHDREKGFFCGALTSLHFAEGAWDLAAAQKFYLAGASFAKTVRSLGIEQKEIFNILPHTYLDHDGSSVDAGWILLDSFSQPATPAMDAEKSTRSDSNAFNWLYPDNKCSLDGGCQVHLTTGLADHLPNINGLARILQLLQKPDLPLLEVMQTLVRVLKGNAKNQKDFEDQRGYLMLYYLLLSKASEVTSPVFDLLFEIATDGSLNRQIRNQSCFTLIVDLIMACNELVQKHLLRSLLLLMDVPENLQKWRDSFGLNMIFEMLHSLPEKLRPPILRLLDKMAESLSQDELGRLFAFLTYEKRQFLEIKAEICDLLLKHMQQKMALVETLKTIGGIGLLISLLDLPSERLRLTILKMIGVLLVQSPSQSRLVMNKLVGFEAMWLFLAPFPVSADLCDVIIGIAFGNFKCEVTSSSGASPSPVAEAMRSQATINTDREMIFPEALHLLLELLKGSGQHSLAFAALTEMKRILTGRNMEVLWDFPWLDWFDAFLQDRSVLEVSSDNISPVAAVMDSITQKMIFLDLTRKNGMIAKMKGAIVENDTFMIQVVDLVLDYIAANPILPVDKAPDIFRNLLYLMRYVEKEIPCVPHVYQHFISVVNSVVMQNNSAIRSQMRLAGLLDFRDDLVIHLLQGDELTSERVEFLRNFSFDLVADQPKFRESNGLLFLIRNFFKASYDKQLQHSLGETVVHVLLPIEENRKAIAKIIEDPEVFGRLNGVATSSVSGITESSFEDGAAGLSIASMSSSNVSIPNKSSEDSTTNYDMASETVPPSSSFEKSNAVSGIEEFLIWYSSTEPDRTLKRNAIEARIESKALPLLLVDRRNQDKVNARRSKRLKLQRERQLRNAAQLNKSLTDVKSKGRARLAKYAAVHQQYQDTLRLDRQERTRLGEEFWRKLSA